MQDAKSYGEHLRRTRVVFRDGLTALVCEHGAQPLASLQAYVPGGFLDDPEDAPGLSAVTAAARLDVGRGSPGGTARRRAQALGGALRVRVEARRSLVELTVPSSRWRQALRLQREVLLAPFDAAEGSEGGVRLRRDIDAAVDGLRDELADPAAEAQGELAALAFGPRWRRRVAPGGVTPGQVAKFHGARYVPAALTLVVTGDVVAGDVLGEIHRLYGAAAGGGGGVPAPSPPLPPLAGAQGEGRRRTLGAAVPLPRLSFGFPAPRATAADKAALEVAAAILGMGEASILNARLRDGKGLASGAHARFDAASGAEMLVVELEAASPDAGGRDAAELGLWAELHLLGRDGPSEAELGRAVAWLERAWWERLATVGGRGGELARDEFQGDWKRSDRRLGEIRKVAAADVRRVAGRYLAPDGAVLVEQLPLTAGGGAPAPRALPSQTAIRAAAEGGAARRAAEDASGVQIPAAPPAFRADEMRHPFQAASILRGPEIYIREDHTSPLVEMGLFFPGGLAQEGAENAGVTRLMLESMLQGADEARRLELYGGSLTPVLADDYFGFRLTVPSRHLAAGFERLKKALKSPGFDATGGASGRDAAAAGAEFEKLRRRHRARAAGVEALAAAGGVAEGMAEESLFRRLVGGTYGEATVASLDGVSIEAVRGWYGEKVRNVKPFVVIVGDVQGTAPASFFVGEFSGSRMKDGTAAPAPKPVAATAATAGGGGVGVRRPAVLLGFQAPPAGDADMGAARVLENYLGEDGRFAEEILERDDAIFRITCGYRPRLGGGGIVLSAKVRAGREMQALSAIREEVGRLGSQPLPYADFQAAKAAAAGVHAIRNQTGWAQIETLTERLLAGGSLDGYLDPSREFEEVGEDVLRGVARAVLDMDKAVTVVSAER
jgi:zinc protease